MSQPSTSERGLDGAARRIADAFEGLEQIQRAVQQLADLRGRRAWSAQEYDQYLLLLRKQRVALRRYLGAHRAFDALRHRVLRHGAPTVDG